MAASEESSRGKMLATISQGLVQLHRECYGKGPDKAKTYAVDDTVMCMLKGGFTAIERTLIEDGKPDDVEQLRRSFQGTMKPRFTELVEQATDRQVIAYLSQVHTDPDLAVELFVLEPTEEAREAQVGAEEHSDGSLVGSLVIAPDTSAPTLRRRLGNRPATLEELETGYGPLRLPPDEEG